jgi:hypothetical protein
VLFGGPCDGQARYLTYEREPPDTLTCRGATYHFFPGHSRGALVYATQAYIDQYNVSTAVRGQRDVFRAWHRFMTTLGRNVVGERRRIIGARHRIRRAVR